MRVLLTGPSGRLGPHLVEPFRARYDLATFDLAPSEQPDSFVGDLSAIEPLRAAMRGADVVVHLAATSDEAPFVERLLGPNVVGIYNVLEAARLEKVRRVVFASSGQAVGRAARDENGVLRETDVLPRPHTIYGATKVWGETLGRHYHDKHGLEFIAIRIGAFEPYDSPKLARQGMRDIWLSPRDAVELFQRAIETPDVGYAIVNGTSICAHPRFSLRSAREVLGYQPREDSSMIQTPLERREAGA